MNGGGTRIEAQSSTAYSTDESHDDSCCSSPLAFPIPVLFSITPRVSLPSHFRLGDATSCNTHESRSAAYAIQFSSLSANSHTYCYLVFHHPLTLSFQA